MAKKQDDAAYRKLKRDLAAGTPEHLYVFYGEERYLLEYYLGVLRTLLLAPGMEAFNHKRFDGRSLDLQELADALDALPVFAEHTLIEVSDFDLFSAEEDVRTRLLALFSDLPDYVTLVWIYDALEFKAGKRSKLNDALKAALTLVEFPKQEQSDLQNWIIRRFGALGKQIDRPTAEYFSFLTGGLMTAMVPEIEKTAAFCETDLITREAIDAVVTPVLEASVYRMTDALLTRRFNAAAGILADLLARREVPHRILYAVSQEMRRLLAAKVCQESGGGLSQLMELCGIRYESQGRSLLATARRRDMDRCRTSVRLCADAALRLNQTTDGEALLTQLLVELAAV